MLEATGVTVRFGGNTALHEASITAERGQVSGLIGPNGAGKTTLFNVLTGLLRPAAGSISLDGHDITRWNPTRRARLGLGRTFQRLELFSHLDVRENIDVAVEFHRGWSGSRPSAKGRTDAIIERLGLHDVADCRVDELSTGRARLVEVARALAIEPKVLLLDEPASGLDEVETDRFGALLRDLAETDHLAVVIVEHDMRLVMEVCDVLSVLDLGHVIACGPPAEVRRDPAVLEAYLGPMEGVA
ncbi:MAG: ABC-type branched-chain amino acid transport system, ATPase component, partial [Ilumatobacteraceae bacterium]|nr:ABC-type branched-chain amino acid transport system, ATPase component [Ilumatobacteraceae bacterium]MCU1391382.1 ABC-type branched-chain amino acid transport system, ATPase component [Ilumatobacteraceae bacterium]